MIDLQFDLFQACEGEGIPSEEMFRDWIILALNHRVEGSVLVSMQLVSREEMTTLNENFRKKSGPTNVLSFPVTLHEGVVLPINVLGDIIICPEVVYNESKEQGKALIAHWAHLTLHGTLHLLGFDHIEPKEAEAMEALESQLMAKLGYDNPYDD